MHTLRHAFASAAGERGYSELTIAAMPGHAAGSATGRCVHIDDAVKSAVERVPAEIANTDSGNEGLACPTSFVPPNRSMVP